MMYINIDNYKVFPKIASKVQLKKAVILYLEQSDLIFTLAFDSILILTPNLNYSGLVISCQSPLNCGSIKSSDMGILKALEKESNFFCIVSNDYAEILEIIIKFINDLIM
jgi:hypothetical protein